MMQVIKQCSSPNFNDRTLPVNGIVIHYTEEELDDTFRIFANDKRKKRVSSHYVIDRDGAAYVVVPEEKRAWHAGVGSWRGITDLNSASIGIELVYKPGEEYQIEQIDSLIDLCHAIKSRYDIKWVIGHSDCAFARGKVDPGPSFQWERLAEAGIGIWPDGSLCRSHFSTGELLSRIGYDVTDINSAIGAFSLHFCPWLNRKSVTWEHEFRNRVESVYAAVLKKEVTYV